MSDIESRIVAACEAAVARGWTIERGFTLSTQRKACCALGALGLQLGGNIGNALTLARQELGFERTGFTAGFDGQCVADLRDFDPEWFDPEQYALGQRIAARFCVPEEA